MTLEQFKGLFIILLIVFIIISILRKAIKFGLFCFCILCLMQIGFMLSQTSLNNQLPLDKYFKYDIVSSITNIWENEIDKDELKGNINNTIDKIQEEINK